MTGRDRPTPERLAEIAARFASSCTDEGVHVYGNDSAWKDICVLLDAISAKDEQIDALTAERDQEHRGRLAAEQGVEMVSLEVEKLAEALAAERHEARMRAAHDEDRASRTDAIRAEDRQTRDAEVTRLRAVETAARTLVDSLPRCRVSYDQGSGVWRPPHCQNPGVVGTADKYDLRCDEHAPTDFTDEDECWAAATRSLLAILGPKP